MKIEQNELEQRLWMGREAIIAAQQKKVDNALAMFVLQYWLECSIPYSVLSQQNKAH